MSLRNWRLLPLVAALVVTTGLVACSDDDGDDAAERQELAELAERVASINGFEADQADIDFYMAHVTDSFVQLFGAESVEACAANAAECIGDPLTNPTVDPEGVDIDGDSATFAIESDEFAFNVSAIKDDDEWKLDSLSAPSDELPEGVETVNLTLDEFSFAFNMADENVTSGSFAFHVSNAGDQTHEVVLVKLPDGGDLSAVLESEDPESAGAEFMGFKFPIVPGDELDMAIPTLEPGSYALVCFLPDTDDPEGTPHAFKGMTAEFTVE